MTKNGQEEVPETDSIDDVAPLKQAFNLYEKGITAHLAGEYEPARTFHEQSLILKQQIFGVEAPNVSVASSLHALGSVYYRIHDYTQARQFHGR